MTFIEGMTVTLAELAKHLKTTVDKVAAEANDLGPFIGEDWAGKSAVSAVDARALASGEARRAKDHDEAWRRHIDATERWEKGRENARAMAAQQAHDAAMRAGRGSPYAAHEAQQAGSDAARRFEQTNPQPTFAGHSSTKSWFDKVKEAVA